MVHLRCEHNTTSIVLVQICVNTECSGDNNACRGQVFVEFKNYTLRFSDSRNIDVLCSYTEYVIINGTLISTPKIYFNKTRFVLNDTVTDSGQFALLFGCTHV